jgi:hypothetical protein
LPEGYLVLALRYLDGRYRQSGCAGKRGEGKDILRLSSYYLKFCFSFAFPLILIYFKDFYLFAVLIIFMGWGVLIITIVIEAKK